MVGLGTVRIPDERGVSRWILGLGKKTMWWFSICVLWDLCWFILVCSNLSNLCRQYNLCFFETAPTQKMEVFIFAPARNDTFISNMPLHHSMGSRTAGIWICCLVKHHDIIPLLANCDIDKRALCLRLRICFYHGFIFFLSWTHFVKSPFLLPDLQ